MPQFDKPQLLAASAPDLPASPTLGERFDFVISFLRRRYLAVLVPLVLCIALGALYLFTTPPTYTASATILIEPRKSMFQQTMGGGIPP